VQSKMSAPNRGGKKKKKNARKPGSAPPPTLPMSIAEITLSPASKRLSEAAATTANEGQRVDASAVAVVSAAPSQDVASGPGEQRVVVWGLCTQQAFTKGLAGEDEQSATIASAAVDVSQTNASVTADAAEAPQRVRASSKPEALKLGVLALL
jgi:hypothetical protein